MTVNPGIITALIAAGVSVLLALATLISSSVAASKLREESGRQREESRRQTELQGRQQEGLAHLAAALERDAKEDERAHTSRAILDQYREPLQRATLDLASRLDNIRNKRFFDLYLTHDGHRARIAVMSTLYRFAKYWCVVEGLYDRVALPRFENDEVMRSLSETLRQVGRTFARDIDGVVFMMWQEEQRAVAELMRADESPSGCIGFATFVDRYDKVFAPWFGPFASELNADTARTSRRLRDLQSGLARLAEQLDRSGLHEEQWKSLRLRSEPDAGS